MSHFHTHSHTSTFTYKYMNFCTLPQVERSAGRRHTVTPTYPHFKRSANLAVRPRFVSVWRLLIFPFPSMLAYTHINVWLCVCVWGVPFLKPLFSIHDIYFRLCIAIFFVHFLCLHNVLHCIVVFRLFVMQLPYLLQLLLLLLHLSVSL